MATYYVNGSTGNDARDGLAEIDLNSVITGTGPMATIETAISAATAGDTIRVASGTYTAPNTTGYVVSKQLAIIGDPGTILQRSDAHSGPIIDISITGGTTVQKVTLKNLKLKKQTAASSFVDGDYGVKCALPNTASTILEWLSMEDIEVVGTSDSGFYFAGNIASNTPFVFMNLVRCTADNTYFRGFEFHDVTTGGGAAFINVHMDTCFAINNEREGLFTENGTYLVENSYFELNSGNASADVTSDGQVHLRTCVATILNCEFEDFTSQTCKYALTAINCPGLTALGNKFTNATESASTSQGCYYLDYSGGGPLHTVILPSRVSNTTKWIVMGGGSDTKVWAMEPFNQAGTVPSSTLVNGVHIQGWT